MALLDAEEKQSRSPSKVPALPTLSAHQQESSQAPGSSRQPRPSAPTIHRSVTSGMRRASLPVGSPSSARALQRSISRRRSTDGNFAEPAAPTPTPSRLGRGLAVAGLSSLQSERQEASPPLPAGTPEKQRNPWTLLPGMPEDGSARKVSLTPSEAPESVAHTRLARAMNVPVETVREAQELFDAHAEGEERPRLTKASFLRLLCQLGHHAHPEDVPHQLVEGSVRFCNLDQGCGVEFRTFLAWFTTQSFREEVLLHGADLERRMVARGASDRFEMPLHEVEQHRRHFERFDTNKNGVIDPEEFERVVRKCAKLPVHVDIPEARLKQLWNDCDVNRNGKICFEEFLVFYQKHFEAGGAGFLGYYRGIRSIPGWTDNVVGA